MKATGIVRRIDDLGRVAIPKEIRRMLRIKEGDPLELFSNGNTLVLRKWDANYSEELNSFIEELDDYIGDDFPYEKKVEILKNLKEVEKLLAEYEEIR